MYTYYSLNPISDLNILATLTSDVPKVITLLDLINKKKPSRVVSW